MGMRDKSSIAIVGGGIAGAAAAFFLAGKGAHGITIFERDRTPGARSTGRNAAILRSLIPDPLLRGVARESAAFYREPPDGFALHPLLDPVGLFLVARDEYKRDLLACLGNGREMRAPRQVDPSQLYDRLPWVARGLSTVLYQPDEGVLDVHGILQSFLQGATALGVELRTECDVLHLRTSQGRIAGLETSSGFVSAGRVILAGGGWAADLAADAGFPIALTPYRRHLLVTEPMPQVDRRWPVVWILGDEFYFRPESGGLLMCACDTVQVSADRGETTDPGELEKIAAKAARWLPALADARVARAWAGMRTFAPDHRFVVGPDPRLHGLFWAAGLGGHGITCAPVVGKLLSDWVLEGKCAHPAATALAPARLLD